MKLFITKKRIIKTMAEELAYLQIRADWWYYCFPDGKILGDMTKQDASSRELDSVGELREICRQLGILKEVYDEAYKIYDFKDSGSDDFEPNVDLIDKLNEEFCKPRKKKRIF